MKQSIRFFRKPVVAGIIVFLFTMLVAQAIINQRLLIKKEQRTKELEAAAQAVKERIETAISEAHAAVNTISVSTKKNGENSQFDSVASKILEITKSVDGLGLVEGEVVTHFYPLSGNESLIGHNVFKDTLRNKELLKSLEIKDLYFAGPYSLIQGGTGIVGRLPIYKEGKYYGFATVLIKLSTFLRAAGLDSSSNSHFIYELSKVNANTGKEEFFLPEQTSFDQDASLKLNVANGNWTIYVMQKGGHFINDFWIYFIVALLISILFGAIVWYLVRQPYRLQKLVEEKMYQINAEEKKYATLFNQAMDPILVIDNQGNFIEFNTSFSKLLGYTREELMQKNIIELLDPSDLKSNPPDYQLNPDNELVIRERKLVTKNGQVVELEISRKKIADNRILGMARNVTEYKKVQKQIALSESTLRAAFEYSAIGMVMVSMEGKYLRTNIEFSQMTGYSREELMQMNFTDTTYKDDIEGDIVFIDHVIRGEMDSIKREKRYVCKDGNIIWVKLNASVVRDADGTPLFVISQSENITEQKKADLEIQKLNRLYKFISEANEYLLRAENIDDLFKESCRIAVELGGVRMAWVGIIDNDKMVQPLTWFGHEDGYLKKIAISSDINHPGGKGPSGQAIRSRKYYFCNDIDNDPAMEIWRIDALQRNYHSSICYPVVIKEEVKAVFTMYVSETNYFNDTEIKLLQELVDNMAFALEKIQVKAMHQKAENNLAESEEKFRTLVEQSMVGVYILQDNKFVYVNPGFEKIAGYSKEELIGHMSFEDMIHEDDIQTIKENYGSVANGEKIRAQYILRTIHGSGQLKHIEIILSTILYKDRPAIIGSAIDITDRIEEGKRIEQAIIDAQEKERLQIGMELHDNVKQIIGASILQLDVLKRKLGDATTAFGIIDNLIAYNNEAVNELRRLSHQLAPSVDSTISLKEKITILASNMNIGNKLIIDIDVDEMPAMLSNKLQLTFYRVIQEQLNNIVKYAKAAHVKITIKIDGHNIALAVADDGQGFDINQKKAGIGLENIRRRAGLFDGKTKIESSPGRGCRIAIEIPCLIAEDY